MPTRRRFIELIPVTGAALVSWEPACAELPFLDEHDPHALGVGYVADAARVDGKKYPKYNPGQTCATCELYQALPSVTSAVCVLFPRKLVAGKGWCDAFRTRRAERV